VVSNVSESMTQPVTYQYTLGASILLIVSSAVLLSLAAAPFGQWYLAWIALAPWLLAVGRAPTVMSALLRGWLTGILYFAANLWWLWTASVPGTVALIVYFAFFWAIASGIIRQFHWLAPIQTSLHRQNEPSRKRSLRRIGIRLTGRVFAIAVVWVAIEWLRCYVLWGFFWMPLGSTQSPIVVMCQVADIGGPWIVSFWVALVNGLVATVWIEKREPRNLRIPSAIVAATIALVALYGVARMQSTATTAGPRIMVFQSNFPHLPGGAPTVGREAAVEYYLTELEKALTRESADLVVLPESAFPPINDEARRELAKSPVGPFLESTHRRLLEITLRHRTALLVGGTAVTGWATRDRGRTGSEIRNSAYFIDPVSNVAVSRYDKIHLVPFSERAPLVEGPQWLRRLAAMLAATRASQPMQAGELSQLKPFYLSWSDGRVSTPFFAPICLENVDPRVPAHMIRGMNGSGKNASFVVNLSNDGWFATLERHQHLQTTIFRCIENRVPMARSSNTGISGFIDSVGRVHDTIPANTTGIAVRQIGIDGRLTFYTRFGDVFAMFCIACVATTLAAGLVIQFAGVCRCRRRNLTAQ
jgi:apolipoprotein N-acyltransferase